MSNWSCGENALIGDDDETGEERPWCDKGGSESLQYMADMHLIISSERRLALSGIWSSIWVPRYSARLVKLDEAFWANCRKGTIYKAKRASSHIWYCLRLSLSLVKWFLIRIYSRTRSEMKRLNWIRQLPPSWTLVGIDKAVQLDPKNLLEKKSSLSKLNNVIVMTDNDGRWSPTDCLHKFRYISRLDFQENHSQTEQLYLPSSM